MFLNSGMHEKRVTRYAFICLFLLLGSTIRITAQQQAGSWQRFWTPADTFHQARFWIATGSGTALYAVTMVGLNEAWYKTFPRSSFHLHNDWGEWRLMDKFGHAFTTYTESRLLTQGARWTGMRESSSRWLGTGVALGLQTSIEWLDGHSSQWGFSWPDMGFNGLGALTYAVQDMIWRDQRVVWKVSNWLPSYPAQPRTELGGYSLRQRSEELFGSGWAERYLKDYNAQSVWLSISPKAFFRDSRWPPWLNIALGYSAENMFGGYANRWVLPTGQFVQLDATSYPRYSQYLLSLDIDFTRIPTKSPFLKAVFEGLNAFKFPFPGLEYNSLGQWKAGWLY